MAKSSEGNYLTVTENNHNGTQTERTFQTRGDRQQYLKTRHQENGPRIPHQTRTVEHTGGDSD